MALSQWPRLNWVVPSTKASLACLATSAGGAARAMGARQRQASTRPKRMVRRYPAASPGARGPAAAYYARRNHDETHRETNDDTHFDGVRRRCCHRLVGAVLALGA